MGKEVNTMSNKTAKNTLLIIIVIVIVWLVMMTTDYWQTVHEFEKPVFAQCHTGYDDGGSGTYTGLGYSIQIEGNFMPLDEYPEVTKAEFLLLGKPVAAVVRD